MKKIKCFNSTIYTGVNKYFHMVCIWEKFRAAVNKDISLKAIWDHLESMYDLVALVCRVSFFSNTLFHNLHSYYKLY